MATKSVFNIDEWYKLTKEGAQVAATIHPSGVSMRPLIRGGRDTVIVMPLRRPLKRGDIVLFRRADGQDIMHRVWKIKSETITTFGDGCWYPDEPITEDKILGLAVTLKRAPRREINLDTTGATTGKTREINLDTAWRRGIGRVWLFFSPLRRCFYRLRSTLHWIERQIKKRA